MFTGLLFEDHAEPVYLLLEKSAILVDNLKTLAIMYFRRAGVAQLVEQLTCNQQVPGSSPGAGSMMRAKWWDGRVVKGSRL